MKVIFVYHGNGSMGVEILSAFLKANGHDVDIALDPGYGKDMTEDIVRKVKECNAGLVCFSVVTSHYQWACKIAERLKMECNAPIIFGGIHPTSVPENVIKNKFVDFVCIGEGEESLLELVNSIEKRKDATKIKNIWSKKGGKIFRNPARNLIENLNELPFGDKGLFQYSLPVPRTDYDIMTSRGCPFNCTYCLNSFLRDLTPKQKYLRRRSVDHVIEELKLAKEKFSPKIINFLDDVFVYDTEWLRDFSAKYMEHIGLPFTCLAHPLTVNDERIEILKRSGCVQIQIGVQTVNEKTRREVLKRYETNAQILNAIKIINKYDIDLLVDHIADFPYETEKDLADAIEFYSQIKMKRLDLYFLTYYPNTPIIETAKKAGILNKYDIDRINNGIGSTEYNFTIIRNLPNLQKKVGKDKGLMMFRFVFLGMLLPKMPGSVMKVLARNNYKKIPLLFVRSYIKMHFLYDKMSGISSPSIFFRHAIQHVKMMIK